MHFNREYTAADWGEALGLDPEGKEVKEVICDPGWINMLCSFHPRTELVEGRAQLHASREGGFANVCCENVHQASWYNVKR